MGKSTQSYEELNVDSLVPYEKNARTHSDEQVEKICKSITEFGFVNPVLVNKGNVIIAGHGRVMAAKKLGLETVPCLRVEHLTDEQMRAYVIADNKLAEDAGWDMELVREELEALQELDFDIELTGFTLDDISFDLDETDVVEDDYVGELPEEPRAKLGDIYQLGNHRLMCGDSTSITDIEELLDGAEIDMIYTDMPYGMGLDTDYSGLNWGDRKGKKYEQGIVDDFKPEMISTIFSLDVKEVFLWGADYFAELIPNKNSGSWLVWDKTLESNGDAGSNSEFELCWSKQKHKREVIHFNWFRYFGLSKQDIKSRIHPTQKPLQVITPILEKYKSDNVLDLFGGYGSTLMACEQLNRKCFVMELDTHYVDVIIDRWENFTGKKAVKIS